MDSSLPAKVLMPTVVARICAQLPAGPLTRFAPSLTGYLHMGHVSNAVYVWGLAGACGGKVVLRMEDHDRGRARPEYEQAILDDLDWLGLTPDIAPVGAFRSGPTPYRQSDNAAAYEAALAQLKAAGDAYSCECSRREIVARTPGADAGELRYDNYCRDRGLPFTENTGIRICIDPDEECFEDMFLGRHCQVPAQQCGDVLLRDRNGNWTYHFAVVVDDRDQGIDLVIRGADLLASTGRHIRMARLLQRPVPPLFLHHPLVTDNTGRKLSKRANDISIGTMRASGMKPEQVLGQAAAAVALLPEPRLLRVADLPDLFV